ncbi:MAG: hypothetical protein R3F07_18470 [Opitutaceae bacterium]
MSDHFQRCLLLLAGITLFTLPAMKAESSLVAERPEFRAVTVDSANAKDTPAMRIRLESGTFQRTETGYESTYSASVLPFFFFSEAGSIRIEVSSESLRQLEAGGVISFTGQAVNQNSKERRIEGRAYPDDPLTGQIRIVIFVGKIELIFKSAYRFVGESPQEDTAPTAP